MGFTRRALVMGGSAALGAFAGRAFGPMRPSLDGVPLLGAAGEGLSLNDASGLSDTPIWRHDLLTETPGAMEAALRARLAEAAAAGRPVALGAARHSMGGQALPQNGLALTFAAPSVTLLPSAAASGAALYRVQAGTRWSEVIAALDPFGLSPKVMQSNNDFGMGATFSVNAHGWPAPFGPMGSSVQAIEIMLADGRILRASRTENDPLFKAAMGGYGLMGVILALELEAVPNTRLVPEFQHMAAEEIGTAFPALIAGGQVPMAYGRLNVDRAGFFTEAMLVGYREEPGNVPALAGSGFLSRAARPVFRAQPGNEWVKRRRWGLETGIAAKLAGASSRNNLLNEPVITLDDRDGTRTDILHEYFVPPAAFAAFVQACRQIIPASYQELMNITLRWVEEDKDSLLAFAKGGPQIASVLLFSQEMSARAEADMARMTEALIDAVLDLGGSYYLPYRPHARLDQFTRAYPRVGEFLRFKREFDPGLLFRGGLWDHYLSKV